MKEEWREEQAGIAAFTKASAYMKRELLWHLNEGEFDWREWFDRRPSSAFMRGFWRACELYEQTQPYTR